MAGRKLSQGISLSTPRVFKSMTDSLLSKSSGDRSAKIDYKAIKQVNCIDRKDRNLTIWVRPLGSSGYHAMTWQLSISELPRSRKTRSPTDSRNLMLARPDPDPLVTNRPDFRPTRPRSFNFHSVSVSNLMYGQEDPN